MPNIGSPLIGGAYETHSASLGKGGLRTVADWIERNAIIEDRLEEGMQVYTESDGVTWQLKPGYSVPTIDGDWEDVSDLQVGDGVTIIGTGTLLDPFVSVSGVSDHDLLNNLNWASAGHTIDAALEVDDNYIQLEEISTPDNPLANYIKMYAKHNAGFTKLYILDSLGTETELGAGGGATELPDLTDVDAALDYTNHNVFQADGVKYTGASYSHTWLDDIGSYTHAELDSHVDTDVIAHAAATNLLHTTGSESKAGLLTFSDTAPQTAIVPADDDDLCNKAYVDSVATGLEIKASCIAATTTAGTLASDFEEGDIIDTYTLVAGDRILIKNQASAIENGIYTVNVAGAPTRATDYDETSEVQEGTFTSITAGSANVNKQFVQITMNPTLGVDPLVFTQLSAAQIYTADGQGIEVAANQFSLELDGTTLSKSASGLKLTAGLGAANRVLGMNSGGSAQEYKSITAGSNVTVTHTANDIEISASVSGIADYFYTQLDFHSHLSSSYTWTNMPAVATPLAIYKKADLTGAVEYRICTHQAVAGFAGADLNLQYSTDGVNWYGCDLTPGAGEVDAGTGTGLKTGSWATLAAGATQDVRLRLIGKDGDGVADPQWREIWVEFKYNASIADHSASDTVNNEVTIYSNPGTALTWTNMPAAVTEFLGSVYGRQRIDLTKSTHYRIYVSQSVAGYAGSDLNLQYSLDGTTWAAANSVVGAGELDVGTGTGVKVGAWAALKEAAMEDVYIRLVGKDGNGVADPAWRQVKVQFREYTYGQGVTGNDTEVLFNDGGATGTDSDFTYNKTTNKITVPNIDVDKISNLTSNGLIETTGGDGTLGVTTKIWQTAGGVISPISAGQDVNLDATLYAGTFRAQPDANFYWYGATRTTEGSGYNNTLTAGDANTTGSGGSLTLVGGQAEGANMGGNIVLTPGVGTPSGVVKITTLSTDGFVKTSSSNGTLTVDTNTYAPLASPTFTGTVTSPAYEVSSSSGLKVTAAAATSLILKGTIADGGTAVGVILDNSAALSTAGAKLTSFRSNNVEKAYVDYLGSFNAGAGTLALPAYSFVADPDTGIYNSAGNTLAISCGGGTAATFTAGLIKPGTSGLQSANSATGMILKSAKNDGVGVEHTIIGTTQAIADGTSTLLSIQNNGVTKCSFNKDGLFSGSIAGNAGTVTNGVYTTSQVTVLAAAGAGDYDKYLHANAVTGVLEWTTVAGSGANTALSNLSSVAINTTLVSDTDNTDALGTAAIGWSDLFLGNGSVITWSTAPSTADLTLTHSSNLLTLAGGTLALETALVGSDANFTDFSGAQAVISQGNTLASSSSKIGVVGEAVSDQAGGLTSVGVYGVAKTSANQSAYGVFADAKVNNTADTATAIGLGALSTGTHAGGVNTAVYAQATGGTTNYSFYGVGGKLRNDDDFMTSGAAIDWDLIDNNASALSFDTTGKAGILELVTTNSAECVKMSGGLLVGSNANFTDWSASTVVISNGDTSITGTGPIGLVMEGEGGAAGSYGGYAVLKTSAGSTGVQSAFGARGYVHDTSYAGTIYSGWFDTATTHAGGRNTALYAKAAGGATNYALESEGDFDSTAIATDWDLIDNDSSALSFDAAGKTGILEVDTTNGAEGVNMSGRLKVGTDASFTDFAGAKAVSSSGNTGLTDSTNYYGLIGESLAINADKGGIGLGGFASAAGNKSGIGVKGLGTVANTADTATAYGGDFRSVTTHAGGDNVAIYASAANGANNYALWINSGDINAVGATDWDLIDNNASALSFDTTGKSGILEIVTTDGSEGVKMSGGLEVTGTSTLGEVQLGETGINLDTTLSADEKWSGITIDGTSGVTTLAVGDLCYLNNDDSRWELADANLSDGYDKQLGICILAAADGAATKMLVFGKVRSAAFPVFTVGARLYMSETAGDITETAPTTTDSATRCIGIALTAEDLMFNPSPDYYTHI